MKKILSLALSMLMLLSVFSCLSITASAASPSDLMYVERSAVEDDQVTFTIYLKKNISLIGTIVKAVYDPSVLTPVDGGAHSSSASAGLFVADKVAGVNNAYSMAFVSMDGYNVGKSDRAFMTVTFKVKDSAHPKTNVKFYCVEFSSSNSNYKIEKNEANPALIKSLSFSTLNKIEYVGAYSVENGIRIEWKANSGATEYWVYKHNGSKYVKIAELSKNKLYYDDNDVSPNTTEKYFVRAYNSDGRDESSSAISGHYVKAPGKVSASVTASGVKVSWYLVDGATSYRVYRRVVNSNGTKSGWTLLYTAGAKVKTYTDNKNLESGTKYEYTVRSYTSKGTSAVCRFATVSFYATPSFKITSVPGGIKVNWNDVDGAAKYEVYRKYNGATSWTRIATVTGNSFTDKNAISGRRIYYTVRAVGSDGKKSSFVSNKNISYVAIPNLVSVNNTTTGVQLKWDKVGRATNYRIYRKAAGDTKWTLLTTVGNVSSYTDKSVKSGTTYKYTVRAVFSKYVSYFESGLSIKYLATPKITSIGNTTEGIKVKWGAVGGASQYRLYRKAPGAKSWTCIATVKSTQYVDENVKNNTTYRYTVRAVGTKYSAYDASGRTCKFLNTPELISAKNVSSGINVKWEAVSGVTQYRVYRKAGNATSWTNLGSVKSTQYTDKNVKNGVTYRYTVRAVGSNYSGYEASGVSVKCK